MQTDVDTMQQYLSKYGDSVMTSVYHLREALVFLTEKPVIIQQAVYVDILKRHNGKARSYTTVVLRTFCFLFSFESFSDRGGAKWAK